MHGGQCSWIQAVGRDKAFGSNGSDMDSVVPAVAQEENRWEKMVKDAGLRREAGRLRWRLARTGRVLAKT